MKRPKAIVALKASPHDVRRLVAHTFLRHGRGGDEIASDDRRFSIFGDIDGIITRRPAVDVQSLLSTHHGKGKLVRHIVLSMEDCADPAARADCFRRLEEMAREFVARFAPGAHYIAVVHQDRMHPHVHLVVCNSINGRTIDWSPKLVREMQSMSWTAHAIPGRGTGKKAVAVYPLAKQLDAKTISTLTPQQIHELVSSNQLSIGRVNNAGSVTSLVYNGRKIRLSTVQRFAATSTTPRVVLDPVRRLVAAPARSASLDHPPRRRRATARRRRRAMDAGRTRALPAQPNRATPAPTPRVAPVLRPALPGVVGPVPDQPGLAPMERTQSLERSEPRRTPRADRVRPVRR